MSVDKLRRVIQRVQERNPDKKRIRRDEFERAILYEVGTCTETVYRAMAVMKKLGWIRVSKGSRTVTLLKVE